MISRKKFKIFPNLYKKDINKHIILFNPLKQSIIFYPKKSHHLLKYFESPKEIKKKNEIISKLIESGIIIEESYDYNKEIEMIRNKNLAQPPYISNWYIIVSQKCNLNCSYCFINKNRDSVNNSKTMNSKISKNVVNYITKFTSAPDNVEPCINFFGGEPLTNFKCIKSITTGIIENEQVGLFNNKHISKYLVTNGTLIKQMHVDFFKKNEIEIVVSIDGDEKIHNTMRKYHNGTGTFRDVLKGYNLIRKAGKVPMISCTVSEHNVDFLPKIAEFFAVKLEAQYVGFNLLMGTYKDMENKHDLIEKTISSLFKAFDVLRKYGIYEDTVCRPLIYLIEGKIRSHFCGGNGNQLVISPEGEIGPCHGFLDSKKYFFGNIFNELNPMENETIKLWNSHSQFNMSKCNECPSISMCGGGCVYEAISCGGTFWDKDERYCKFCRRLLDYYLEELYNRYFHKLENVSLKKIKGQEYGS